MAGRSSFAPLQAGIGDLGDGDDSDLFGSTSSDEDSGTQVRKTSEIPRLARRVRWREEPPPRSGGHH